MLIPREHGAYGQFGFPIAAALAAGRLSAAALALTVGCFAAFLVHESLLVLIGVRGPRARREHERTATRDGAWMAALALAGVSMGVWLTAPVDRWTILVPAVGACSVGVLALRHVEKTTAGEMIVAVTAASCALPVGVAAGLSRPAAALIWMAMTMGFWAATAAVRATIARQRREPHVPLRAGAALLAIASPPAVYAVARAVHVHPSIWIATVPLSMLSLVLAVFPPSARHLRQVGWALIAASAAAAALLASLLRG